MIRFEAWATYDSSAEVSEKRKGTDVNDLMIMDRLRVEKHDAPELTILSVCTADARIHGSSRSVAA